MMCVNCKSFTLYLGGLHNEEKMFFNQVNDMQSWVSPETCSEQEPSKERCSQTKGTLALIKLLKGYKMEP